MCYYIGVDIGGTKCSVVRGDGNGRITGKVTFPTVGAPETLAAIFEAVDQLIQEGLAAGEHPEAIGVSCGSPMDSRRGIIREPPNLPGWIDVPITEELSDRTGLCSFLCNDANACALAEWKFGAGKGAQNMIFLTFGTGMGAGLILDGRLYVGATDAAGEVGHVRLDPDGPVGYHKAGSVEGFCSGGGIARMAHSAAEKALSEGCPPSFCPTVADLDSITAQSVAEAAHRNPPDPLARAIYRDCGTHLGRTLAMLVDLFNPERIVIGSIFTRAADLLIPAMEDALSEEALPASYGACRIVPAALTDSVGDLAALTVAVEGMRRQRF